jgi:copper chaperone
MTTLKVIGMSCGHCASSVREALDAVPGVTRVVAVDLEDSQATVEGEAAAEDLLAAVRDRGFEAEVVG